MQIDWSKKGKQTDVASPIRQDVSSWDHQSIWLVSSTKGFPLPHLGRLEGASYLPRFRPTDGCLGLLLTTKIPVHHVLTVSGRGSQTTEGCSLPLSLHAAESSLPRLFPSRFRMKVFLVGLCQKTISAHWPVHLTGYQIAPLKSRCQSEGRGVLAQHTHGPQFFPQHQEKEFLNEVEVTEARKKVFAKTHVKPPAFKIEHVKMGEVKLEKITNQRSEENSGNWNPHTYWEHELKKIKESFNNFTQYVILEWSLDYRYFEGKLVRWNSVSLTLIKKKTFSKGKERNH